MKRLLTLLLLITTAQAQEDLAPLPKPTSHKPTIQWDTGKPWDYVYMATTVDKIPEFIDYSHQDMQKDSFSAQYIHAVPVDTSGIWEEPKHYMIKVIPEKKTQFLKPADVVTSQKSQDLAMDLARKILKKDNINVRLTILPFREPRLVWFISAETSEYKDKLVLDPITLNIIGYWRYYDNCWVPEWNPNRRDPR